jgi:hypothetical protein
MSTLVARSRRNKSKLTQVGSGVSPFLLQLGLGTRNKTFHIELDPQLRYQLTELNNLIRQSGYLSNQTARALNIIMNEGTHLQHMPKVAEAVANQIEIEAQLKAIAEAQARIEERIQQSPEHWSSHVSEDA